MKFHLKLSCLTKKKEKKNKTKTKNEKTVVVVSGFLESVQDPRSAEIIKIVYNGSISVPQQFKKYKENAIHSITQNYKTWTPEVIDHKEDKVEMCRVQRNCSQENVN